MSRIRSSNHCGCALSCDNPPLKSGISRVVYYSDKYRDDWKFLASRRLLDMARVRALFHSIWFCGFVAVLG